MSFSTVLKCSISVLTVLSRYCYDAERVNSKNSTFGAYNLNNEDMGIVRSRICLKYGGMTNVLRYDHFSISDSKRVGTTCNFFHGFFHGHGLYPTHSRGPVTYAIRTLYTHCIRCGDTCRVARGNP